MVAVALHALSTWPASNEDVARRVRDCRWSKGRGQHSRARLWAGAAVGLRWLHVGAHVGKA